MIIGVAPAVCRPPVDASDNRECGRVIIGVAPAVCRPRVGRLEPGGARVGRGAALAVQQRRLRQRVGLALHRLPGSPDDVARPPPLRPHHPVATFHRPCRPAAGPASGGGGRGSGGVAVRRRGRGRGRDHDAAGGGARCLCPTEFPR